MIDFTNCRIVPGINVDAIEELINAIPCITDLQKDFYKQYLNKRYELMIRPAYELITR